MALCESQAAIQGGFLDRIEIPEGGHESSPAIHRWENDCPTLASPGRGERRCARAETLSFVPGGTHSFLPGCPAMHRWAIFELSLRGTGVTSPGRGSAQRSSGLQTAIPGLAKTRDNHLPLEGAVPARCGQGVCVDFARNAAPPGGSGGTGWAMARVQILAGFPLALKAHCLILGVRIRVGIL